MVFVKNVKSDLAVLQADNLDYAIREKNQENAQAALTIVRESLDQVLSGRVS